MRPKANFIQMNFISYYIIQTKFIRVTNPRPIWYLSPSDQFISFNNTDQNYSWPPHFCHDLWTHNRYARGQPDQSHFLPVTLTTAVLNFTPEIVQFSSLALAIWTDYICQDWWWVLGERPRVAVGETGVTRWYDDICDNWWGTSKGDNVRPTCGDVNRQRKL